MEITCDHPASRYGLPVILSDEGMVMDYGPGVKAFMAASDTTAEDLAEKCGVSVRTVHGWRQGRPIKANALNVMAKILGE